MKKTIPPVLMLALVVTPCLAQQVEPDGLFSIEGTLWGYCAIGFPTGCHSIGFNQETVYHCSQEGDNCQITSMPYVDLLVVSIAGYPPYIDDSSGAGYDLWIMQPIGFGVYTMFAFIPGRGGPSLRTPPMLFFSIGVMIKIDDDWTPPGIE